MTIRAHGSATGDDGAVSSEVAPHPRIRDRRRTVRRDQGRRRLRRLVVLVGLLALVVGAGAILASPLADIDHIRVQGASATSEDAVVEATGLAAGEPMIDVDEAAVAERVRELAWVDRATVERQWPGTVAVRVTERQPVAIIEGDSEAAAMLVGGDGHVLGPVTAASGDLPRLRAPAANPGERVAPPHRAALEVVAQLPPSVGAEVTEVVAEVGASGGADGAADAPVTLMLRDGVEVRFGPPSQTRAKLEALKAMLLGADRSGAAAIDVRVPTAPVLTNQTEDA